MDLKRLGPYDILSPLGAGGMGEVYRAKDTKLGREVALKILPPAFTGDSDRLARFRREAKVLAALNHPHIGAIYGLDEASGQQFLVLELVDGESLDKRIARGKIPIDEALRIAKQIAEALEAAHEKGIIHRDLKPANIALTHDGSVKVLDFGLAKATEPAGGASLDVMNSPTITSPAMMTGVGMKSVRMLCEPWRDMAAKGSAIGYRYRAALSVRSVLPESKDYAMVPFEAGPGPKTESMSIGSIQDRIYPRMMGISAGRLAAC